ncbi:MAG: 3-oxoacyl-ACP reductase FabG [Flavobacteriales bacterium]|nr:3-oxoacyl-ACP reductase FabG [Flavobacteriales bacterium]
MENSNQKWALVTGASRGIGRAVSYRLAQSGYNLLLNYNSNDTEAGKALREILGLGVKASLLKFDVSSLEQTEKILGDWFKNNPGEQIEVLVNNAGIKKDNLLMWMTENEWNSVMDIAAGGFFNVTRTLIKHMLVKKYGRIVNVVSLSGIKGLPGQTNYSASKAAVIGATKALAQEVGRRGITVNAVAPGFILTDMTEGINEKDYKALIPVGRFGTTKEVADVVAFFASPECSYVTGQVISVNGGLYT